MVEVSAKGFRTSTLLSVEETLMLNALVEAAPSLPSIHGARGLKAASVLCLALVSVVQATGLASDDSTWYHCSMLPGPPYRASTGTGTPGGVGMF